MSEIYAYSSTESYGNDKIFEITYDEMNYYGGKCKKVVDKNKYCSKIFVLTGRKYYLFYDEKSKDRGIMTNSDKSGFCFWLDCQMFVPERFTKISKWALSEHLGIKIIVSLK